MPQGYEMLQVGERPPSDPKYQTREVVMAPPGTVVAPLPKGVEPTMENAMMAIMAQLMGAAQPDMGMGVRGMAGGGLTGGGYDLGGLLGAFNAFEGQRQFNVNQPTAGPYSSFGRSEAEKDRQLQRGMQQRGFAQQNLMSGRGGGGDGGGGSSFDLSRRQFELNKNQQAEDNRWRWAQLEMQKQLGNRGLDVESQLGQGGLAARNREAANQMALGQRGLDIQSAADAFSRIMAGLSEASVGGVRAGATPSFGAFG